MPEKKLIQSVLRALDILEYIGDNGNSSRIQEVSDSLNLNKSTVHSLISTLEYRGYIEKSNTSPKYSLGVNFFKLGKLYEQDFSKNNYIDQILCELTKYIKETTYFAIKIGDQYLYMHSVSPDRNVHAKEIIGTLENLNSSTAIAKVFNNLETIQKFPYRFDLEEVEEGMNCIAFPFIKNDTIIGVIGISGPSCRCTESRLIDAYNKYIDIITNLNLNN